ncbi:sorting nexin-14-like [Plodia interpunctella]|uniref:sorting nexin-14-like n=1 Tax=Plodia interpunctella TaxID=58824 RepID=UPI002367C18B|nr:sorting nexin-14-like [Plodia interpunctella]
MSFFRLTMTERCQRKFTEKFDNQKYIIYFGVITASLTVLYFCRFHFVTLAVSYGLGCVACYFALNSSYLNKFVDHLKCHFDKNPPVDKSKDTALKGCVTCGSKDCSRHEETGTAEPWIGLQIHKQLDQAIEDFYNTILEQFISSWFSRITLQPFFVDELRYQLRYASACLLQRAFKIDYARFITDRLLPCALRHFTTCSYSLASAAAGSVHPAAASRDAEIKYLRCVTDAVMPYLLHADEVQNSVFRVLIREIFAGWVLLSITDVLADPYILNTIIILATGDETMAQLPTTPNYKVQLLETFARRPQCQRRQLLRVDLDGIISEQATFYAFVQYMKTTHWLQLLQFYRDIKAFQSRLLNPEPCASEVAALRREASLLAEYTDSGLPLRPDILTELKELLAEAKNEDGIKKLQTSRALYEAARQSHAILEKIMLPRFLHSEEFYKMILGPRLPMGYQKQVKMVKRPRGNLRPESIDGQVLDCFINPELEGDGSEKMDILHYLDALSADEFHTREHDLTNYKVVLTDVEMRLQYPPRRGTVRVFTLAAHRARALDARLWTVQRSEHDFHLLRSKLHEFHGDSLLLDLPLPSRRDNSPLETLRYKYEDFLQRLLQKSLLQTSELLHLFLTVDGDFSTVVQASTLNANSTDLANLYQSVTYKLKKEKGQHLESFLMNLLFSTDLERFQALKQGTGRDVEEGVEVSEDAELDAPLLRPRNVRDIHNTVFGNNWDISPEGYETRDVTHQNVLKGFTQCFMYFLMRVISARSVVSHTIGCLLSRCSSQVDAVFCGWLDHKLREWFNERRLAHFIRLGHNLLFGKKSPVRSDAAQQRRRAQRRLPAPQLSPAFTLLQTPHYNKQLVYNLLDLCLMELFPELGATDKKQPKS